MLEMNEVANILKNATQALVSSFMMKSARGTSTFDGMCIAKAVAEYTAGKKLGAKTLFATHYHELTSMASGELKGIVNYNIAARKKGDTHDVPAQDPSGARRTTATESKWPSWQECPMR